MMTSNNLMDAPVLEVSQNPIISLQELGAKLTSDNKDIVFFTGAGFSKAWNSDYPTGLSLFSINFNSPETKYNFLVLADKLHIPRPSKDIEDAILEKIELERKKDENEIDNLALFKLELELKEKNYDKQCYDYFSEIKYHLDLYKKYPGMLPNFLDQTLINGIESEIKSFVRKRFCSITERDKPLDVTYTSKGDQNIINFFKKIKNSGSSLSFISTNYDFIIEKIFHGFGVRSLDRGIIERRSLLEYEWNNSDTGLYKLNGGFEIFTNLSGYYIDYNKSATKQRDIEWDAPCIIIPSQEQDYSNKYFENCFIKASNKLRESSILVFIGYSLPVEDNAIRFLLKNFVDCSSNQLRSKEVYVISRDVDGALNILERVKDLFPRLLESGEQHAIKALNGSFNELCELISND
ncbi:TPA: SIR2 family protein [Vibrio vulnificus]